MKEITKTEAVNIFRELTGHEPYPHQAATYEALERGEPVILRAPTGSGKSEAVFVPFVGLRGESLPRRMIYCLPMRTLVNSLSDRFKRYAPNLDIKAQHGKKTESVLFNAECIVATLDQVVTSYACAPLSLGVRHGNIPAGAVASSILVFDEVHTFDPVLGLQSSLMLAERMKKMSLPFIIMSATLPTKFICSLAERFEAKTIEIDECAIPARTKRTVKLEQKLSKMLSSKEVLDMHNLYNGRTIVVCNTVERAIKLFSELKDRIEPTPILIHSRFFDDDRQRKENDINSLFGKNETKGALLVTTQVVEVGMDISCDLLITELAPVDSLIQRAGRCARWGGKGTIAVYGVPHHGPYETSIVEKTKEVLGTYDGERLSWSVEKCWVDEVLDETYRELSSPAAGAKAMLYLSTAAFHGRPSVAEKAVRDILSVEVSLHDNPESLGNRVFKLPRCRIHPGTLRHFFKKRRPLIWSIDMDREVTDEYSAQMEAVKINSAGQVISNRFYVIHSDYASYSRIQGLVLGEHGEPLDNYMEIERPAKSAAFENPPYETWRLHALKTVDALNRHILPEEEFVYKKLAAYLNVAQDELLLLLRQIAVLHDLGKLTVKWQSGIGAKGEELLAHSGVMRKISLPPHATVSAYILRDWLRKEWGNIMGDAATFAIAHHHSVRASKVPEYKLCNGWYDEVSTVLTEIGAPVPDKSDIANFEFQETLTTLSGHLPAFEKEKTYNLYVILSRALRLADRIATGGEDAVLHS